MKHSSVPSSLDFSPETQATVTTAYRMGFECAVRACVDLARENRSKKIAQAIKDRYSTFFKDEQSDAAQKS